MVSTARRLWLRRVGIALVLAVLCGYVPYHVYASSGLARYLGLRAERDALHAGNLKLHAENQRLRAELDGLTDDVSETGLGGSVDHAPLGRAALERAARDELGLVKPGELVFKLEAETTR
jgi:cell division protein FtsB